MILFKGKPFQNFIFIFLTALILSTIPHISNVKAETRILHFWDHQERISRGTIQDIKRFRFLTTTDFPPFSFIDGDGHLTGFNIDLARAICTQLNISQICEIQALPFDELIPALEDKRGEAIIAGLSINSNARQKVDFTHRYFTIPARLITTKAAPIREPFHQNLTNKRIGVLSGSALEKMLASFFPNAQLVDYDDEKSLFDDLKATKIDGIFGDGMRLTFWLSQPEGHECCAFSGDAYYSQKLLGSDLAIAYSKLQPKLGDALNYALRELEAKGVITELYLRYFPNGLF